MKIEHYVVGVVGTNCYFTINEDTKECLIIDPGDHAKMLAEKITDSGYTPVAILLTHGHFDHIMGVEGLRAQFDIPVYVHEDDADMLESPQLNACTMIGKTVSLHMILKKTKWLLVVHRLPCLLASMKNIRARL